VPGLAGHLTDIEHIVLLMQENRSFDHYFGRLSGTHGFNDSSPLFQQKGWNPRTASLDPAGITLPYRFDTTRGPSSVCARCGAGNLGRRPSLSGALSADDARAGVWARPLDSQRPLLAAGRSAQAEIFVACLRRADFNATRRARPEAD